MAGLAAEKTKRRLSALQRDPAEGGDGRKAMAWSLFFLFAAGTVIALAVLPLAGYLSAESRATVLGCCGVAAAACLLIALAWRQLSMWAFQLLAALGTLVITAGTYAASSHPTESEMFYIWVALYAAYFFNRRQAIAQIVFVGVAYAFALLIGTHSGNEISRWVITMGSTTVTALIFGQIKGLLDQRLVEKANTQRELEATLSLQQATLESTADGLLVVDREGRMVSFNQRFKEMWRIPDEMLRSAEDQGATAFALDQVADPDAFVRKVRQLNDRPQAESYDMLLFKDGRAFERYSRPQRAADGEVHGRVWSFRDVTERERIQSRLRHLADHDPLTGLLNRRRFEETLVARVADAARYEAGGAVLLLDLDNFKYVNDSLGHGTGDAVIRSVADLIRGEMRETDVLARLGGDEFALLLPYASESEATQVAEKLLDTVRRHRAVFRGRRLRLTTSIGVTVISNDRVQTAEDLLVEADVALYEGKEAGRDRFCVYSPSGDQIVPRSEASPAWSERIRRALDGDGFVLFAQPIRSLATGEVSQYELLVRMVDDHGALLPPHAFLPSAERSGMIQEIDAWVTRSAIQLIDRHRRAGRRLRLEINLSGRTLGDPTLPAAIAEELKAVPIDPANLIFEVTETAAVLNMDEAGDFASALSKMGCRFALDDFGAGFGSFYYLKYLPLDFLKIDGDFIGDLGSNPTDQAVVKAIVELSRSLGKATIAEFVGDARTLELLRGYGVDYAQGHHIGRPRPIDQVWPGVGPRELLAVRG